MVECEEAYGFLPCSLSLGGSISLMIAYGYILLQGASFLSEGSELLLEVLDPGIIGGLVLPVLGALPDSLIIIFSGLGVSRELAQEQVAVGVGTLAGSTIMLLTIALGGSMLVGKCDLDDKGEAKDKQATKSGLFETGVTTDTATLRNAAIMVASCVLFLPVQLPTFFGHAHTPLAAFWGSILCFVLLAVYCAYQVLYPELQRRRIERAKLRRMREVQWAEAIHHMSEGMGHVLGGDEFNQEISDRLFDVFDTDQNGYIEEAELHAFMVGLAMQESSPYKLQELNQEVRAWMGQLDSNRSGKIDKKEFREYLEMIREKKTFKSMEDGSLADNEQPLLEKGGVDDDDLEEEEQKVLSPRAILVKAISLLFLGAAICAVFSDPMVDAVNNFSKASHIPSFFIAFVVTPLASNSSELVSSLNFAAKKKKKNISLTFSQVYGAVTLNNTMCLGLFLAVVYLQDLSWTYTSEVVIIVGTTLLVGIIGMTRETWRTWLALPVLALYPLAVLLVYLFDYILKWDG